MDITQPGTIQALGAAVVAAAEEQSRRASQKLSTAAQYVQLIKAVQETRAVADVLACLEGADLVLSDDLMFQVHELVVKLQQKLPRLERSLRALRQRIEPVASWGAVHGAQGAGGTASAQTQGAAQQGQQQQQPLPSLATLAAGALSDIQLLQQQLSILQSQGSAAHGAFEPVQFAQRLAATHNKLHLRAAAGDGGLGVQQWRQELAEYQCCDYEDAMEAAYLMVQKQQLKLTGGLLSSKERKVIQGRITDHKARIKQLVQKYNCIRTEGSSSRPGDITDAQITAGDFPWAFRSVGEETSGVRLFKDKLKYWGAYNSLLRAREHKIKIKEDADRLVAYYEQREVQLLGRTRDVYPSWLWLVQPVDKTVCEGLLALTTAGLHAVQEELMAARAIQQKIIQHM